MSEKHPNYRAPGSAPAATAEPTRESGKRLASLERRSPDGSVVELRVSLDEYEGRPFVSVRQWFRDRDSGEFFPTKKGTSIRLSEVADVIAALQQAVDLAGDGNKPTAPAQARRGGPPDRSREWTDRPRAEPPTQPGATPPWSNRPDGPPRSGEDVDEY